MDSHVTPLFFAWRPANSRMMGGVNAGRCIAPRSPHLSCKKKKLLLATKLVHSIETKTAGKSAPPSLLFPPPFTKRTVSTGDGARAMSTIASPTKPQALGRVAPPTDGVTESRLQERAPPSNTGVGISGGGSPASRCVRYGFRRRHTIPLFPRCVGPSHFLIYDPPSPFPLLL